MFVPSKAKDGKRYYGRWAGNPHGNPEDHERCIAAVKSFPGWTHVQCMRKRGYGPDGEFCKQHAKKA